MADSQIQVQIVADAAGVQAGMQQAAASVTEGTSQIEAAFAAANGAVESFEASLKALQNIAIFALFTEGAEKVRTMVEGINEGEVALLHMSERTGVSIVDLHGLGTAFEATGASGNSFERAMRMIEMRLQTAAMGSKTAQEQFAALGLNWETLRSMTPEQIFFKVADAVSNMQDGTEKLGAVVGVLGAKFGTQLLPAFNLGSAGLRQIIEDENKLNPVTQQTAEQAEKLHVQWLALTESSNSFARALSYDLRGALGGIYTDTLNLEGAFIELETFFAEIKAGAWTGGIGGIKMAFDDATAAGLKFVKQAQDMAAALDKIGSAGQVAAPDVAKLVSETSPESTYEDSESSLLTHLEARQREIKDEADAELAIWTTAAKDVETVDMSRFALEEAQIRAAASQRTITAKQETADLVALNQQELTSKLTTINAEIAALQQAGGQEKDYYDKIAALQAQAAALTNQYAAKELQIQTQTATQSENAWAKAFDTIGGDFNRLIDVMLAGGTKTESMGMKIAQFGGSMIEGAIGDVIKEVSIKLGQAFASSTVVSGLETSLTAAWNGVKPIITNILGSTLSGALGLLGGTATQGPAIAAETGLGTAMTVATPPMALLGPALTAAAPAMTELATALLAAGIGVGIFEHGGIVPSAAGGMISGGGLSILHPREMVLPANLSEGLQNAIAGGTFGGGGGGGNVIVNYSVTAMDGASVDRVLSQHGDVIANAVLSKMRNGRGVGQNINRGNFRR